MKKLFLGFAALAMLAGCSKNETFDNNNVDANRDLNLISFQSTAGATRGVAANLTTLQDLTDGFEVIGISNFGEGTAASLFGPNDATFKNNYKYTSTASQQWDWVNAEGKAWPTDVSKYPIKFFAANPFPAGLAWDAVAKTVTPEALVEDQIDQLSAVASVTAKPITGIAPLDFQHILSAIKFKLMSSDNYVVNIKEIKIINVTESRDFNYATGAWDALTKSQIKSYTYFESKHEASTQTLAFAATAAAMDVKSGNFGNGTITDEGQLMLVPQDGAPTNLAGFVAAAEAWVKASKAGAFPDAAAQTALAEGAYLQVTYNMTDGTDYIVGKAGNYVRVLFPLDLTTTKWEMTKRYIYTLYLGTPDSSNGTVMDPDYKDEDGGDTGTDLDNPKVDPGKPVTQGKITFKVDVKDWTDVENDIK